MSKQDDKLSWYFSPAFVIFWLALFYAVMLPIYNQMPSSLSINREHHHQGEFVAERAAHIIFELELLGPKSVGNQENEQHTVQLLRQQIEKVRRDMLTDLYELDVDVQEVSGSQFSDDKTTPPIIYRGIQNVIVKLQRRNTADDDYLLINSHFDTVPGSPGAGDAGTMVGIMLELLRVLATNVERFQHPIVFLFNGAAEVSSIAAHGFITQHKWAANCKAFINLDSVGSGDQEMLLQTNGQHSWLTRYYHASIKRPFASSLVSEIFHSYKSITLDSNIFYKYGGVPGLDLVCLNNGYIYHTPHDKYFLIPHSTLQVIGTNALALIRTLANTNKLSQNHTNDDSPMVYYDFLRLFMLHYSNTIGCVLNCCIVVVTIAVLGATLWRIAAINYLSIWRVTRTWLLTLLLQFLGCTLAFGLPAVLAVFYDKAGTHSMTLFWYTNTWLVLGVYVCPAIFGLSIPTLLYFRFGHHDKLNESFKLQLTLQAQAILIALTCIITTCLGYRSAYLFMIALCFHICSSILNLISTLYRRKFYWIVLQMLCQVLPFLYFSYITFVCLNIWIPIMGRSGSNFNPDLYIAVICSLGTVLCLGFIIPLLTTVRRSYLSLSAILLSITLIFVGLTLTPLGFPYRETTNMQRIDFKQVQRIYYEHDGFVNFTESGFQFGFHDRRGVQPIQSSLDDNQLQSTTVNCSMYIFCALPALKPPLNNWLPINETLVLPAKPNLVLMKRTPDVEMRTMRFDIELNGGPPYMNIYIHPFENVRIVNCSFLSDNINQYNPPYEIVLINGIDQSAIHFYIVVEIESDNLSGPHWELGIGAQYRSKKYKRSSTAIDFLTKLPAYTYANEWPSLYEIYVF